MAPAATLPAALNHLPSDSWGPLTLSSVFHWVGTRTPGHGAGLQGAMLQPRRHLVSTTAPKSAAVRALRGVEAGVPRKGQQLDQHLIRWHCFS